MYQLLLLAALVTATPEELSTAPGELDDRAVAWAERAMQFAEQIQEADRRDHAYYRLTYCFARANRIDAAMRCAENVVGVQKRVYAFAFTARQAEKHNHSAAVATAISKARATSQPADNLHAHSHVVRLLLEFEKVDDAIAFSSQLRRGIHQVYTLNKIASQLAEQGDVGRALSVVEQRIPAASRDSSHAQIALACAKAGSVAEAENVLQRVSEQRFRDAPLDAIARLKLQDDDILGAYELASQIGDIHKRGELLAAIVDHETRAMDDETLKKRFAQEPGRDVKVQLAETMVKRSIAKRDFVLATEWIGKAIGVIKTIPRDPQRSKFGRFGDEVRIAAVQALHLDIATAHHAGGNIDQAIEHIEIARQSIANLDDSSGLGKVFLQSKLLNTISSLKLTDRFKSARTTTTAEFLRPMATAAHCASLVKEGNIEQAMELAEEIKPRRGTGVTIGDLVTALVEQDDVEHAVQLLVRLEPSEDIGYAYEAFGRAAFNLDERDLDLILAKVASSAGKAHACIGISNSILLAN